MRTMSPLFNFLHWWAEAWVPTEYDVVEIPRPRDFVTPFRPQNFTDYIGQAKAKSILESYITATIKRGTPMPHVLIHGKPGYGKTTLAKIIAKMLDKPFVEVITSTLANPLELVETIKQLNGGVLFMDEIHSAERKMCEAIYSLMEDFQFNSEPVTPFTLIGATTELGELVKNRKPFVDRFKRPIALEDYTPQELGLISRQYRNITFPNDQVDPPVFDLIGQNCRGTPRIAIRLVEATVYIGSFKKVLCNEGIVKDGYTLKDLQVLEHLADAKGAAVGLQGIAAYLETSAENYLQDIEPFLLRNKLLTRTGRGRKLTDAGKAKLHELERVL